MLVKSRLYAILIKSTMQYLTIILIFTAIFSNTQNITTLNEFVSKDTIPKGKSVFYGKFNLKKLGCSMGFPNYVRLVNLDTKGVFVFWNLVL